MSFSSDTKQEIIKNLPKKECCKKMLLCGTLACGEFFSNEKFEYSSEREYMTSSIRDAIHILYPSIDVYSFVKENQKGHESFFISIYDEKQLKSLVKELHFTDKNELTALLKCPECSRNFLSGVFLQCGQITDPEKEYHLSLHIYNDFLLNIVQELSKENDIDFKLTVRDNTKILYLKDSEKISDFLTMCHASIHAMNVMNVKIYKELRNHANRSTNCDIANQDKAKSASIIQIKAIDYIFNVKGFDYLNEDLQEVALLRKMNPDATLSELATLSDLGLSKSGINHRLKKIEEIAKKIEEEILNEFE